MGTGNRRGVLVIAKTRWLSTVKAARLWSRLTGVTITADTIRNWHKHNRFTELGIDVMTPEVSGGRYMVSEESLLRYLETDYAAALKRIRAELATFQRWQEKRPG